MVIEKYTQILAALGGPVKGVSGGHLKSADAWLLDVRKRRRSPELRAIMLSLRKSRVCHRVAAVVVLDGFGAARARELSAQRKMLAARQRQASRLVLV
ncbi:hypothetical protein Emed_007344 [Eimeria media]